MMKLRFGWRGYLMVFTIFKFIVFVIIGIIGVVGLYTVFALKKFKKSPQDRVPPFFQYFYDVFTETNVLGNILENYYRECRLIYGSTAYAEVMVAAAVLLYPCVYVLLLYVTVLCVQEWYFIVLLAVAELVIPYLLITNRLMAKAARIREGMVGVYESSERFFANKYSVVDTFVEVARNQSGSKATILNKFINIYSQDPSDAFDYLNDVIGDEWGTGFCQYVHSYDDEGIDPCSSIRKLVNYARRDYSFKRKASNSCKAYQMLILISGVITIACKILADRSAASFGIPSPLSILTTVSIFCVVIAYILVLIYERS